MAGYLDTSLLVPLFIREPGTARARTFLTANASQVMVISPWTITEFSSALALKQRVGTISGQRLQIVAIESADFVAAAGLWEASGVALRAGDGLHLAVCRRVRGGLATMDMGLAAAGQELGLTVELIQA